MISLNSIMDKAYDAACEALDDTVETIFTESKEDYCPVDKGDLKASAKNELIEDTPFGRVRVISYNTPYAPYVHEIIRYHHGNKSAKFLEIPVNYHHVNLQKNIKSAVEGSLDH